MHIWVCLLTGNIKKKVHVKVITEKKMTKIVPVKKNTCSMISLKKNMLTDARTHTQRKSKTPIKIQQSLSLGEEVGGNFSFFLK